MKGLFFVILFLILSCGVYAQGAYISDAFAYWNLTWNGNCDNTEGPIEGDPVVRVNPDPVPTMTYDNEHGVYSNGWNVPSLDENRYYEYDLHATGQMMMVCFYLTMEVSNPNMRCAIRWSNDNFVTTHILPWAYDHNFNTGNPYEYYFGNMWAPIAPGQTLKVRVYAWGTTNAGDLFYNKLLYMCGHTYDDTLPVELATFEATPTIDGNITLSWTTHSETDVQGYHVFRNTEILFSSATCLTQAQGLIPAYNTSTTQNYSFVDHEIGTEPETYYYWLQYTEFSGELVTTNPIRVEVNSIEIPPTPADVTSLQFVGPNPFYDSYSSINIRYGLKYSENVSFEVYNIKGQLVNRLYSGYKTAIESDVITWNGKDMNGVKCGSGIYYILMNTGSNRAVHKIVKF